MPHVFGMVTTRASAEYTLPALESFFHHTPLGADDLFLLIDNDGGFGQVNLPEECRRVCLLTNQRTLSFAENANQVLTMAARAGADALFLNNDVIFTPGWLGPVVADPTAVITPTSNQNHQYEEQDLVLKPVMTLADYQGREAQLHAILARHRAAHRGYVGAYKTNFFCVRIPPAVYRLVGGFDQGFGQAGGEDDDYCIRTYLRGFRVLVAAESLLLHFGGRSTWSGPESLDQWRAREQHFIGVFQKKWGPTLARFLLYRDPSILNRDPSLQAVERQSGIAGLFAEMAQRDGVDIATALAKNGGLAG